MNVNQVLLKPVITEKATIISEQNKYVFKVATKANKDQVKEGKERVPVMPKGLLFALSEVSCTFEAQGIIATSRYLFLEQKVFHQICVMKCYIPDNLEA